MLWGMRPHGTPERLERRRRKALALLRAGRTFREVAQRVKASLSSVVRWQQVYRKKGLKGIRHQARWGRPPRLSARQQDDVRRRLEQGAIAAGYSTNLWTLKRIAHLIEKHHGVHYTHVGVWKFLRTQLRWSCQKPERRALQRDEAAIERWKRTDWPRIKKTARTWGPSRVPRRKRVSAHPQRP